MSDTVGWMLFAVSTIVSIGSLFFAVTAALNWVDWKARATAAEERCRWLDQTISHRDRYIKVLEEEIEEYEEDDDSGDAWKAQPRN